MGYFGARYYDNTSAMWLGVDPLWEKYAGMNPYNYCAGNPVMLVDRDGREPCKGGKSGFKRFLEKEHSRIKSFHINWPSFNDNWYKNNNFVSIKPDVELTAQKPLLRYRDINSSVLSYIPYHFFNEGSSDNLSQAVDYLYNQVRAGFDDRPDFSVCTDISIYIGFTSNINEEQRNIIQEKIKNIYYEMGVDDTAKFDFGTDGNIGRHGEYGISIYGDMIGPEIKLSSEIRKVQE